MSKAPPLEVLWAQHPRGTPAWHSFHHPGSEQPHYEQLLNIEWIVELGAILSEACTFPHSVDVARGFDEVVRVFAGSTNLAVCLYRWSAASMCCADSGKLGVDPRCMFFVLSSKTVTPNFFYTPLS